MRNRILWLGLLTLILSFSSCMRDHDVIDPVESTDYRQLGIIINKSFYHPFGIDTLFINTGDTLELAVSTLLLNPPKYRWQSNNEQVLVIIPHPTSDTLALAIAVGDSGASASFTIYDQGNEVSKTVAVRVLKFWADPVIFESMGVFNRHFYYISRHKKTWLEGKEQSEKSGGHLLTITSEEENRFISDSPLRINEDVWIGLTYLFGNDKVDHWITGEPLVYKNFAGAYTGTDPGIFAEYYFYMNPEGKWNQWHEKINRYVMEME